MNRIPNDPLAALISYPGDPPPDWAAVRCISDAAKRARLAALHMRVAADAVQNQTRRRRRIAAIALLLCAVSVPVLAMEIGWFDAAPSRATTAPIR